MTTPIYYVNAQPHIGTLYSTLLADIITRWQTLMGKKVFFLTGTDEHGQKIQEQAKKNNQSAQEFVNAMIPSFKAMWERYQLKYDHFIRTTDEQHKQTVTSIIEKLQDQDDIYRSSYVGWYCTPCETFVTIEGAAINPTCPTCSRDLHELSEESYFFRLSAYQDELLKFYEKNPHFITPKERMNEVVSFVKSGLKDLSISRKSVAWGIPFPGDSSHTIYVWIDALCNYLSAVGYFNQYHTIQADDHFKLFWPPDIQVLGKDILRFHAVYWPALLMALKLPLPKKLLVHGFILVNDEKMSKSRGNAVEPGYLADQYGVDQTRYYLTRQMAVTQDGNFSIPDMEDHINADLANNLGNLLNRVVTLAVKNNFVTVTPPVTWSHKALVLREQAEETYRFYWEEMNKNMFHVALGSLFKFLSQVNAYFHEQEPWVLAKTNPEAFREVISASCHALYYSAIMLWPIMPTKMKELVKAIGQVIYDDGYDYDKDLRKNSWQMSFYLEATAQPLFAKIVPLPEAERKQDPVITPTSEAVSPSISIDDFAKVELHVGTIIACSTLKESKKLLRLEVDFGSLGKRQILSGVAEHFSSEELQGKQGVFVTNLPPRKMVGYESQGMMLFARDEHDGKLRMVTVGKPVNNGARLS